MGDDFPTIRVAAVQAAPVFMDREASVAKACTLIAEAGANGARPAVFPETWLPGYPVWLDVAPGAALWDHAPAKAAFARLVANAVEVPGPATEALAAAGTRAGDAVRYDHRLGQHPHPLAQHVQPRLRLCLAQQLGQCHPRPGGHRVVPPRPKRETASTRTTRWPSLSTARSRLTHSRGHDLSWYCVPADVVNRVARVIREPLGYRQLLGNVL